MTQLIFFNPNAANSPEDDDGGFNAQPKSKGRDRSPSPPKDDGDIGSLEAATPRGKSSASFLKSKVGLACLGIIVFALLVVGGTSIFQYNSASASAVGLIQQQETLIVANNRGKAGKEPSLLCDSPIKCGHTVTGEELSLFQDVVCTENPNNADCAITVSGEGAELDCNDFMITSTSGSWKYGICLSNRAKAKNCYVQRFGIMTSKDPFGAGIRIEDGGEIDDSEVMFNVGEGILVEGSQDSTTKISDTFVHDNGEDGIRFNGSVGAEISLEIEGVRSINNGGNGMELNLGGSTMNLRVKDSETSYNGYSGFYITGGDNGYVDFEVEGVFNSRYNEYDGIEVNDNGIDWNGEMKVKGVVNLYKNGRNGFWMKNKAAVDVVVDKGGALNSCSNNQDGYSFKDIFNGGSGTFSGDGYTCGFADGPSVANLPICEDCPSCPSE